MIKITWRILFLILYFSFFFFFQAEDGIRDSSVTGVQTCALPIYTNKKASRILPATLTSFLNSPFLMVRSFSFGLVQEMLSFPLSGDASRRAALLLEALATL